MTQDDPSHFHFPDLSKGDLRDSEIAHKLHDRKRDQFGLVFRDRCIFFLNKQGCWKVFPSALAPTPCDGPRCPVQGSTWQQPTGPQCFRFRVISVTVVHNFLKYPIINISFMFEVFMKISVGTLVYSQSGI